MTGGTPASFSIVLAYWAAAALRVGLFHRHRIDVRDGSIGACCNQVSQVGKVAVGVTRRGNAFVDLHLLNVSKEPLTFASMRSMTHGVPPAANGH